MRRTSVSLLVAGLLLAACAPQPSSPPTGDACLSLAQFQASLAAFQALEPSASNVGEFQAAGLALQRTFRDLREAAFDVADARVTELNQAIDDLQEALDDVPDGTSPADLRAAVDEELTAVSAAFEGLASELDCPT